MEYNGRNLSTHSLLEAIKKQASFHRVFVGKKCKCNFLSLLFLPFQGNYLSFFKIISKPREFEFNYNFLSLPPGKCELGSLSVNYPQVFTKIGAKASLN